MDDAMDDSDVSRIAELEAQIRSDPGNDDLYRIYGDILLARGHPRGELIALQCEEKVLRGQPGDAHRDRIHELDQAQEYLFVDYPDELLGPLHDCGRHAYAHWHLGFVEMVSFCLGPGEQGSPQSISNYIVGLLEHGSGRFLRRLEVVFPKWRLGGSTPESPPPGYDSEFVVDELLEFRTALEGESGRFERRPWLDRLYLSGYVSDAAAQLLIERCDVIADLSQLDIAGDNLSSATTAALQRLPMSVAVNPANQRARSQSATDVRQFTEVPFRIPATVPTPFLSAPAAVDGEADE